MAYLPVSASLGFSPSIHPSTGLSTPGNPRRNRPSNPLATRPKNAKFSFLGVALEFGGECRWRRAIGGAACERASAGVDRRRDASCSPSRTTLTQRAREREALYRFWQNRCLSPPPPPFSLSRWCTWLAWLMCQRAANERASGPIMRYVVWGRAPVR